jgi:glycosyltransferase involved in cell wall biosynthesis
MNPTVAVVIPAFNAERFLAEALRSVVSQSSPPHEILVVDDGSTDRTGLVATSVPGVRCIRQENAGVSAARNRGIREASSTHIAFLDADDAWETEKLGSQMEAVTSESFIYSARTETDAHLRPLRIVRSKPGGWILESLLFEGNIVGTPSSVVAPRDALLDAGGFDPRLSMCADWDMWIRLARHREPRYVDRPLVRYRTHGGNMSSNLPVYERDCEYMLAKVFASDLPSPLKSRRLEAECRTWEMLAGCYFDQRNLRSAFRCIAKSTRRRPSRLLGLFLSVPRRAMRRLNARGSSNTAS